MKITTPKIILALVIVLILIFAFAFFWPIGKDQKEQITPPITETEEGETEEEFLIYSNEELNFEIKYPKDWVVGNYLDDPALPRLNFYPEGQGEIVQPITHHSDLTQVSIFPQGIPTEGIFGENRPSNLDFAEEIRVSNDFFLKDGSIWATFVGFKNISSTWGEAGFIFSRTQIANLKESCYRGEEAIPDEQCDPLTGDRIVREGTIDLEMRSIQERMLESFQFINQ